MVKSKKDYFRRIYYTDRWGRTKFHYPKEEYNKLRSKGQIYFHDMDVTCSEKGDTTDPKFYLLTHNLKDIFPKLQLIVQ